MQLNQAFLDVLKSYFVSRSKESTIGATLSPSRNEIADLGKPHIRFNTIYAKNVVADSVSLTVGSFTNADTVDGFHAYNTPLALSIPVLDEDAALPTSVYPDAVLIDGSREMTGSLSISSNTEEPPFVLGANNQDQTVTGLRADSLDKQITVDYGLTGGGYLTSDVNIAVDLTADFTWTGYHSFQAALSAYNILPAATDVYDLGSSTLLWRQAFISQLNAVLFAEQTVSLIGGWLVVPKDQGAFAADVVADDTMVNFGKSMTTGHFVVVRSYDMSGTISTEYMQVGTLVSDTTYNVTRDLAGVHSTDPEWAAGTVFMVLGTTGDGRIELNAYDTPRIQLLTQGAAYSASTEVVRIGDLNGWGPVSSSTYGWAVGSYSDTMYAYYTPASGLVVRGEIKADTGYLGDLSIDGILTIGADGEIRQGTGTLGSDFTGLRVWKDTSVGRIAGYSDDVLQWYAGTDGKLYAGGGSVYLDNDGVHLDVGAAYHTKRAIQFYDTENDQLGAYITSYSWTPSTKKAVKLVFLAGTDVNGLASSTYDQAIVTFGSYVDKASTLTAQTSMTASGVGSYAGSAEVSIKYYGNNHTTTARRNTSELYGIATYGQFDVGNFVIGGPSSLSGALAVGMTLAQNQLTLSMGNGVLNLETGLVVGGTTTSNPPQGVAEFLSVDTPSAGSSGYPRLFSFAGVDAPRWLKPNGQVHDMVLDEIIVTGDGGFAGTNCTLNSNVGYGLGGFLLAKAGTAYWWKAIQNPLTWQGKTVTASIAWVPRATGTGNVRFGLSLVDAAQGTNYTSSWGGATSIHQLYTGWSGVAAPYASATKQVRAYQDITWPSVGTRWTGLIVVVWRDSTNANDTFTGDVLVPFVKFTVV